MSRVGSRLLFIQEINKILGKYYEEVKRIRGIADAKQRAWEAWKVKGELVDEWLSKVVIIYQQFREKGELGVWQDVEQAFFGITQEKYEMLNSPYQLLLNIWTEANTKLNPNKPQIPKPEIPPHQPQETNAWWCANCYQDKTGSYLYNTKTSDGKKFCSEECYDQAYGKTCCVCYKKFLNFRRDDNNLVYCSPCWKTYWDQKAKKLAKELQQGRENSEELKKQLAEIDKRIKTNTEIINSVGKGDNTDQENDNNHRERERESKLAMLLAN